MSVEKIKKFTKEIKRLYDTVDATEHTYRSVHENLLNNIQPGVKALNELKRIECGAPDLAIQRNNLTIGYIETKSPDTDLQKLSSADEEQKQRYLSALPNMIFTNSLDWEFYQRGNLIDSVSIASISNNTIVTNPSSYEIFVGLLNRFVTNKSIPITDPNELATWMAGKAQIIRIAILRSLQNELAHSALLGQYNDFKKFLIDDIQKEDFSDIYAETITYGLFTARLHLDNSKNFTRFTAASLIPKSNPFLRKLFNFIADELPQEISWIIDDLVQVLEECNVDKILTGFGNILEKDDAFIYFYETFIGIYNPEKRERCGIYYTPLSVVRYIIKAVDEAIKTEFGLPEGLADVSKVSKKISDTVKEFHRVQILDPAVGTGTFLAEAVKVIGEKIEKDASTLVKDYIKDNLIPRLHGFELLMAPYAMSHLKLELMFRKFGYLLTEDSPRLSIYLSNSLEEGEVINEERGFGYWLSEEAKGANKIKLDIPIMCVIGNPPYLGESGGLKGWIKDLMEDYKKEPDSNKKLNENNSKWINDLYAQFIRLSSHYVEENKVGIMGLVTNHGYIDNPTFRGMRWHLLNTFDKIWILDLHGNSRRKNQNAKDENVFDIQQGVAIIIAVKLQDSNGKLAQVKKMDLIGSREFKYKKLASYNEISLDKFTELTPHSPNYFFKEWNANSTYWDDYFSIKDLMKINSTGFISSCDHFALSESEDAAKQKLSDVQNMDVDALVNKYGLKREYVQKAKRDLKLHESQIAEFIIKVGYRPFQDRFTFYSGYSDGYLHAPRYKIMSNYINYQSQIGLLFTRQVRDEKFGHVFITNKLTESSFLSNTTSTITYNAPLYLIGEDAKLFEDKKVNFDPVIEKKLKDSATSSEFGTPNALNILDYIYGVLNCIEYREKYDEYLKSDFPRVPYPDTPDRFWQIANDGKQLRLLHLFEASLDVEESEFRFCGEGDNVIKFAKYENEKVYINDHQYIDNIPPKVANMQIGGFYPALYWMKVRTDTEISYSGLGTYRQMLKALQQSIEIMESIKVD